MEKMVNRDPLNRSFYLPRLPREYYQGDAVVFWTLTVKNRGKVWLSSAFHREFRELMFHTAVRQGIVCPIYCLMPDHIHFVWMGLRLESDQLTGMSFLRTHLETDSFEFQHQAEDEVLREKDRIRADFQKVCFYIAANPVRAELMQEKIFGLTRIAFCRVIQNQPANLKP